jgi:hypothetical protein
MCSGGVSDFMLIYIFLFLILINNINFLLFLKNFLRRIKMACWRLQRLWFFNVYFLMSSFFIIVDQLQILQDEQTSGGVKNSLFFKFYDFLRP